MAKYDSIDGVLVYVQVDKPVDAYDKTKPKEFKASVIVTDEDWVDEFEEWCKQEDAKPSLKKIKTAEFEKIFKIPAPEGAGKNVWQITLRKSTEQGATGRPILPQHEPKAYEVVGGTLKDITHTKLIANGSLGAIGMEQWRRNNGSLSISLSEVVVTDLIEYVKEDREEVDVTDKYAKYLKAAPAAKAAAPTKTATKAKPKVAEEDESDPLPF